MEVAPSVVDGFGDVVAGFGDGAVEVEEECGFHFIWRGKRRRLR